MNVLILIPIVAVAALLATLALRHFRHPAVDAVEYLQDLDGEGMGVGEYEARMRQPFLTRIVRPIGARGFKAVTSLTPSHYLDTIHRKLLLAGMAGTVRAEEFVTAQAILTGLMGLAAVGIVLLVSPPTSKAILFLVLLPAMGALFPTAWLNRKVAERKNSILRDLPDTLDLLAISVEAGMGFEGALEIVCQNFNSPLADEFSRTLREMELGLPRRDAFQNLKRRTEVPELSNFVLALLQADALGIPIGRVLKTQASEMRNKRRMWAREKAGKLPVKIMFPLVAFIFPAVLVIVLGPAGSSISKALN